MRNRSLDDAMFAPILQHVFQQRFSPTSNTNGPLVSSPPAQFSVPAAASARPPCSPGLGEPAAGTGLAKTRAGGGAGPDGKGRRRRPCGLLLSPLRSRALHQLSSCVLKSAVKKKKVEQRLILTSPWRGRGEQCVPKWIRNMGKEGFRTLLLNTSSITRKIRVQGSVLGRTG